VCQCVISRDCLIRGIAAGRKRQVNLQVRSFYPAISLQYLILFHFFNKNFIHRPQFQFQNLKKKSTKNKKESTKNSNNKKSVSQ